MFSYGRNFLRKAVLTVQVQVVPQNPGTILEGFPQSLLPFFSVSSATVAGCLHEESLAQVSTG
jgi:hypothetical protein